MEEFVFEVNKQICYVCKQYIFKNKLFYGCNYIEKCVFIIK